MLSFLRSAVTFLGGSTPIRSRAPESSGVDGDGHGPFPGDGATLTQILDVDPVHWDTFQTRITSHPDEAASPCTPTGQTPLCAAIDRDAPLQVIAGILSAHPRAARDLVHAYSRLTPLYLAVARGASPDVVRLVLNAYPAAASQPVFNGCLPLHASADVETARMLIEAFPRGVGWRNEQGYLPLHRVSYAADSTPDVVELLIAEGRRQNLGGKNGGGGVFMKTAQGITPLSAVCCTITGGIEVDEFRSISDCSLLSRSARIKLGKLTAIVRAASDANATRNTTRVWPWTKSVGSQADQKESESKFRILHSVIKLNCPSLLISHVLRANPSQCREFDSMGRSALSLAAQRRDATDTIVAALLDPKLGGYPRAAATADRSGRLPLHYAASSRRSFDAAIRAIIEAAPGALEVKDGQSGLYPFMTAAVGNDSDVDLTYNLLRESPWLVSMPSLNNSTSETHPMKLGTGIGRILVLQMWLLFPFIAFLLHFVVQFLDEQGISKPWLSRYGVFDFCTPTELTNLSIAES